MAKSRSFLDRVLSTPDLAKVVPRLEADIVHRMIQHAGLEESAELVALLTPEQIGRVLDSDIWRVRAGATEEQFDAERFGTWIEVLMQSGEELAASKLIGLDMELAIAGFSRHVAVFDAGAVAPYTTLDGDEIPGRRMDGTAHDIGGYVIEARRPGAEDAIVGLLAHLASDHPVYFNRLMRGCVRLSSGPPEADGFHTLLGDDEQDMFDLVVKREARREKQGYVSPAQARAFLGAAREGDRDAERPPEYSPIARAYFRALEDGREGQEGREGQAGQDGREGQAGPDGQEGREGLETEAAVAAIGDILRDAGVLTQPRALLGAGDGPASRLAFVRDHLSSHPAGMEELAFLTNALVAGCTLQGRPFTPPEASDAAAAACNLGLVNWPARWRDRDLLTAFHVGWALLHQDVCLYAAQRLVAFLAVIRCPDRDIQLRLNGLRTDLARHLRDGAPWRARNALDVLVMLDAASWAGMLGLIDECPVAHAAIAAPGALRSIKPDDFEFMSDNGHIAAVRGFVEGLPGRLTL